MHYRDSAIDVSGSGSVVIRAAFEVRAGGGVLQVDAAAVQSLLAGVAEPNLKYFIDYYCIKPLMKTFIHFKSFSWKREQRQFKKCDFTIYSELFPRIIGLKL
jgi:hypothetical protein